MSDQPEILVVDDEAIALSNLTHVLKKEGYQVTGFQSGPEALKYIEAQPFNLLLTDLKMEKVDGLRLLKRTKELYPDTEVIMVTGEADKEAAIQALKLGIGRAHTAHGPNAAGHAFGLTGDGFLS